MQPIETLIIGGGQAGLALSKCLSDRGREHLVLERGRVGERWRSQRWDSLRLLTPNWMTRLPGHQYQGPDPEGFLSRQGVVDLLERYAQTHDVPVQEATTVQSVSPAADGWHVVSDRGSWHAANVVVATGNCDVPHVPDGAAGLSPDIFQITPATYRNPQQLPDGGVLVVGASATGVQLADELRRSGRDVVLAVGSHNRLPRRYRGRDILWWLDRMGSLDRSLADMSDPAAARREPSLQLVGRDGAARDADIDLGMLQSAGVQLAGRFRSAEGTTVYFAGDLHQRVAEADDRLERLLARIDRHIDSHGLAHRFPAQAEARNHRVPRIELPADSPRVVDLAQAGIASVLWATGFRRSYSWLHAPVLDECGEIVHHRGRTPLPGLYVLGLQFLTRRRSSFLDGVGRDAEEIAADIAEASPLQPAQAA